MRSALLFVLTLFGASLCFAAEEYPSKPVRVIVAFAAGGITDIAARVVSQHLSDQLGKPFVVENRTGASGTIGNELVAKSAPDGYTLMMADRSTAIVGALYKSLSFDVAKDFTPISEIVRTPNTLLVRPSLNANTVNELVALARANPGKLNYGSAGPGSAIHLFAELFKKQAKVDIAHIPYRGGAAALTALLGDQVDMIFISLSAALPHVISGKARALAVTTDGKRSPRLPNVPSISEAGVPSMELYTWIGMFGPAGMPKDVVNKLHAEVRKVIALPSVQQRFSTLDAEIVGSSPDEFSNLYLGEVRRWAEVVKSTGVTPE